MEVTEKANGQGLEVKYMDPEKHKDEKWLQNPNTDHELEGHASKRLLCSLEQTQH